MCLDWNLFKLQHKEINILISPESIEYYWFCTEILQILSSIYEWKTTKIPFIAELYKNLKNRSVSLGTRRHYLIWREEKTGKYFNGLKIRLYNFYSTGTAISLSRARRANFASEIHSDSTDPFRHNGTRYMVLWHKDSLPKIISNST